MDDSILDGTCFVYGKSLFFFTREINVRFSVLFLRSEASYVFSAHTQKTYILHTQREFFSEYFL